MLAGLAGCYSPAAPEDRAAGFANTPAGLLVVEAHVEMSEGVMMPMAHSTPIRIDAMDFRAWLVRGDSLREVEVPYRYRRGDGPEPATVVPVEGAGLLWTHLVEVKGELEPTVIALSFVFLLVGYAGWAAQILWRL